MKKKINLRLSPSEAQSDRIIRQRSAEQLGLQPGSISGYRILRKSIDSRSRRPRIQVSLQLYIQEPFVPREPKQFTFRDVSQARHSVMIAGAGPAGLFAALRLIESGIRPEILERGKDVRSRRRDLARIYREGQVDPDSNYCFGEGGAGTYSDGKLYTRSTKRGDVDRILNLLVRFGADENILYEAHPHIGTNKLPHIITTMRDLILESGGKIHFETKLTGLNIERHKLRGVINARGEVLPTQHLILATGHSARDIFSLLANEGLFIEFKDFALGVRVEHPQDLIDRIQYHCAVRDPHLPPASYNLVQQVGGQGVFSFCMCPGGIIAPSATAPGEIVVNGWSPSKRNNRFANSGMVVAVDRSGILSWLKKQEPERFRRLRHPEMDPLAGVLFQEAVEQRAFRAGGGKLVAPAQRLVDFAKGRRSANIPECSYLPGTLATELSDVLPDFVYQSLQYAFRAFGKKMRGYFSNEAVVVATESRTSSPVRIPRDPVSFVHPQLAGLYPCGEGAGYAGGIVSAAMDGEKVATAIAQQLL